MGTDPQIIKYLSISFFHLSAIVKKEFEALASMISFTGNLALRSAKIQQIVKEQLVPFSNTFVKILCLKPKKYRRLHQSIFSFLANCLSNAGIRKLMKKQKLLMNALAFKLREIDPQDFHDLRWVKSAECLLAVFQNISHINRTNFHILMGGLNINRYFAELSNIQYAKVFHEVIHRSLNVLSKLNLKT